MADDVTSYYPLRERLYTRAELMEHVARAIAAMESRPGDLDDGWNAALDAAARALSEAPHRICGFCEGEAADRILKLKRGGR